MATELENLVPEADVEVEGMRGPKGDKGDSYVLTEADKEEIARKVDTIVDAETDKSLTISGKPADAKAAGDAINDLKEDLNESVTDLKSAFQSLNNTNIDGLRTPSRYVNGTFSTTTTPPSLNNNSNKIRPNDFIYVAKGDTITITNGSFKHAVGLWSGVLNDCTLLRNDALFQTSDETINVNADGFFTVAFVLAADESSSISPSAFDGSITITSYASRNVANINNKILYPSATDSFMKKPVAETSKATLQLNGSVYTNSGFNAKLGVSPFLLIEKLKGKTIYGACSWTKASDYPVAFYDENMQTIGTAYSADSNTAQHAVNIELSDTLLNQYTGAVYCRFAMYADYDMFILYDNCNTFNQYMIYNYPNALFCGDSVTVGFVVDGDIYGVETKYSYPSQFKRQNAGMDVNTVASSGITAYGWYTKLMQDADFENNDLIVFEFGYNTGAYGRFNMDDWNTEGTNTYSYRKMVEKARTDNPLALIILVKSSHAEYTYDWQPVLDAIAEESNAYIIDLSDTTYLNLDSPKYHGMHNGVMDYVHFNREGYNAKAYVVTNMILNILQIED